MTKHDDTLTDDELLDAHQAAAVLNLTYHGLEAWRSRGKGPPFIRISYNRVRYPRAELEAWLAERRENERAAVRPVEKTMIQEIVQNIIACCAWEHRMRAPYDVVIDDSSGQQLGRRVGHDFDRAVPGLPGKLKTAVPPLVVTVTDADGAERVFDVGMVGAPDGQRVPDIRGRLH